jgi:MFS family permease
MTFLSLLKSFRDYRRELWAVILLKILLSYAYFCIASRLVVYLTEDSGFNDIDSADLYSAWGISMSVIQFCAGPIIDRLQIRRSLIVGALINSIGMFMVALSFDSNFVLIFALIIVVPIGMAFGTTVLQIAGKRYAPPKNSGGIFMSMGFLYSAVNIGAMLTGVTIEFVQDKFGHDGLQYGQYHATADRIVILIGAVATAISGLVAALIVHDNVQTQRDVELANMDFPGTVPMSTGRTIHVSTADNDDDGHVAEGAPRDKSRRCWWFWESWAWLKADVIPVLKNSFFQRLFVLSAITIGVKIVYRHIDATLPKVILRAFGPDAHFGWIYSLNPTLIIFIVPPIMAVIMAQKFDVYKAMILGTTVSAASMFIMASDLTLISVITWSVVFTIGEAIYSPLLDVYFMSIAPDGREALYSSLAYAPNLLAKVFVGPMSGRLLEKYCPRGGEIDNCKDVWFYVGLGAMSTPILMIVFYRFIHNDSMRVRVNERLRDEFGGSD